MDMSQFREGPLPHFIGNLLDNRLPFVEGAIKETGFNVFILPVAIEPETGQVVEGRFSVWTNEEGSHSEFWAAYRRIKKEHKKAES